MSDEPNKPSCWKRFALACLRSPVNTLFSGALLYLVFYIWVLGNDAFYYKMLLLGVVLLWLLWMMAKYVLTLLLILAVLGIGRYLYYDYSRQDIVKCEEAGGYWNKKTKQCEEKRTFWQQLQDRWEDYRAKAELLNKVSR
ncbi:MAG: hypothetical protein IJ482_01990 [Alphaproteobacteria bacterium]|nr:hypothetical protein [Alphaproteobacteria bacterium]